MTDEIKTGIWARLRYGVTHYDEEITTKAAKDVIDNGFDAYEAIVYGLIPGIEEVGRLFELQEYFVPEMMMCAESLYAGLDILKPHVQNLKPQVKGTIIIGVVQGDVHDIGKNMVKMMFEAVGFDVYDLGRDVPLEEFVQKQLKTGSDIIALSAMMSTTMVNIKDIVYKIKEQNPLVKVMIGGAPVTEDFADRAGADGYAKDANNAIKEAFKLISSLRQYYRMTDIN